MSKKNLTFKQELIPLCEKHMKEDTADAIVAKHILITYKAFMKSVKKGMRIAELIGEIEKELSKMPINEKMVALLRTELKDKTIKRGI